MRQGRDQGSVELSRGASIEYNDFSFYAAMMMQRLLGERCSSIVSSKDYAGRSDS